MDVKTNAGGTFLRLINKHFHRGTKLNKIFNKNSLKVSYSCMPNMSSVIKSHNARVIKGKVDKSPKKMCNCRVKNNCPVNGKCLSKSVVYKATVTSNNMSKEYIGLAGNIFKERFNNHSKSFRQKKYSKETELSKYVWTLKDKGIDYVIKWAILRKSNTFKRKTGICNLCLEEKYSILCEKLSNKDLLNKRSEMISKCRHGNRPPSHARKKGKVVVTSVT